MICPNCGREIPDGTVCPCSYQNSALSSNPAVNVIKSVGSSTIFLVMAILATLSVVLAVISSAFAPGDLIGQYEQYVYGFVYNLTGINPAYYATAADPSSFSTNISISFGPVFTAVALWLHYVTCKDRRNGNISTAGLTIWKVFAWIAIVALSIACVAVVIVVLIVTVAGGTMIPDDAYGLVVGIVAFFAIFGLAAIALELACQIAKLRVINRAKTIAYNGIPDNCVSQFLIVMTWLDGIFSGLVGLPLLFLFPVASISQLVSAAVSILTALCLTRYKNEMTAVMYPPVMPVYAQSTPYAAPIYAQPVTPATRQTAEQPAETTESDSEQSE